MMYDTPLHEEPGLKIFPDFDPVNPREDCDHLGTMYCRHNRYSLGDKDAPHPNPTDIQLPLYLYDHSGITMSTTPFACPWDSGQVGIIYVSREKVRKEYGVKRISPALLATVLSHLAFEVEEYDQYLRGEVYGYVLDDDDSCWGFYGFDYCLEEARQHCASGAI